MPDMCDIEINTDIFKDTIKDYKNSEKTLHSTLCNLENELRKLEDGWEGDARKEFDGTFPGFYSAMKKDCDMLGELAGELIIAKNSFEGLDAELKKNLK